MAETFNYAKTLATVDRLIEKFGQTLTFTRITEGGRYDPHVGESVQTEAAFSAKCVVLPTGSGTVEAFDEKRDPDLVDAKRRFLLVSPLNVSDRPQSADHLTFEGAEWVVMGCTPLAPAGVDVLYRVGVQRV